MNGLFYERVAPDRFSDGHLRHVAGVLDQNPPWIMRKLIQVLSARVSVDEYVIKKIKELAASGPVVYALKYRSLYDVHFLRMRFAQLGLPVPAFAFGLSPSETGSVLKWAQVWCAKIMGLLRDRDHAGVVDQTALGEIFQAGGAAVLFLVDEKTSRARYLKPDIDPIRVLLELQGKWAGSIAILPMFVLYDRRQPRTIRPFWETFLGDADQPGPVRRIVTAVKKWTIPEVLIGEPVHLVAQFEEFGSDRFWEELPFEVRNDLVAAINARIRVNRGPERLSRTEIKERVLQDWRVQKAVRLAVQRDPGSEQKVRKNAESYVDEIAADQRIQVHHFLFYVLKWLFAKIFDDIDLNEAQFSVLKEKNQQGSLIYVSCHKSHLDYLLVGFLSFVNQMAIPYMAAGKNLSFWPVGPILRNAGAFFLRRTFKGLALYPHVFAAYLKVLVKANININFYIEGGRSRTGKMLPPKVGMLAFLVQAVKEDAVKDLTFVPTFVGYDQVPEEGSHLRELAGREKRKESILAVLRSREVLRKRFGRAYIRFDNPISYVSFRDRFAQRSEAAGAAEDNRRLLNEFAYHLMYGIVKAGVVAPVELVAAGLVCSNRRRISDDVLLATIQTFSDVLGVEGFELAESLQDREKTTAATLGLFAVRGFIEVEPGKSGSEPTVYLINDEKRAALQFYKNSIVNYLWPYALFAAAALKNGFDGVEISQAVRRDFHFLKGLMSRELIWDPLVTDDELLEKTWSRCRERGWLGAEGSPPSQPPNRLALESLRGVLTDLFEVYYCALLSTDSALDGPVTLKDLIRRMTRKANEYFDSQADRFTPLLPSVIVDNALTQFSAMGILDYVPTRKELNAVTDPERADELRQFISGIIGLTG
jgi:glycerol-3-phosphate O-acyltransferase